MKKVIQKIGVMFLFLILAACSADQILSTDWFTLQVPSGISFTETDFGSMVHELETDTVRYMVMDQDHGVMLWFLKASRAEIAGVYDTYEIVMNKMKLELTEKKETDGSALYIYTPIMANGKPLAEQYQFYGIYPDGEETWLVSLTAPYGRIDDKDKFINMFSMIEFTKK